MEESTEKKPRGRPKAVETTPYHEHRVAEAEKKKLKQPAVKEEWYEFTLGKTYDPKKGRKLVRKRLTATGAITDYIGWEKKVPREFLEQLKKDGLLREFNPAS